MKNSNLLTIVATATLLAVCSTASAATDKIDATTVTAPAAETSAESQTNDSTPTSSTITEPAAIEDTKTEESVATETAITPPSSDIEYTCQHDNSERIIRVFNDTPLGLACEVTYEKSTGTQTLWTANFDKEFCKQKAAEFAAKQVGWGWHCVDKDGAAVSAPAVSTAPAVPTTIETPVELEENKTESPDVVVPEAESTEAETPEAVEAETSTDKL